MQSKQVGFQKVVVIIVTYNGAKWLQKCIESLYASDHPSIELFVVDNASTDNSVQILKTFPRIKLYESSVNLGFGQANNIGMKYALEHQYDYVFLLNQDTWIEKDTISRLVASSEKNPDYGIISPLHYYSDEQSLEYFFSTRIAPHYCKNFISDYIAKGKENMDSVYCINFIHAAAWLMPVSVLKNVGGFDPLFFHYGEDNNYCNRAIFHKFKIGITPFSKIYHDARVGNPEKKLGIREEANLTFLSKKVLFTNVNIHLSAFSMGKAAVIQLLLAFKNILILNFRQSSVNFLIFRMIVANFRKIMMSRRQSKIRTSNYI